MKNKTGSNLATASQLEKLREAIGLLDNLGFGIVDLDEYPEYKVCMDGYSDEPEKAKGRNNKIPFLRKSTIQEDVIREIRLCVPPVFDLSEKEIGNLCKKLNKATLPVLKPYIDNLKSKMRKDLEEFKKKFSLQADKEKK